MILLGFQLLPEPRAREVRSIFEEPVFLDPKWTNLCRAQHLTVTDTEWVQAFGSYKTAYIWVSTLTHASPLTPPLQDPPPLPPSHIG